MFFLLCLIVHLIYFTNCTFRLFYNWGQLLIFLYLNWSHHFESELTDVTDFYLVWPTFRSNFLNFFFAHFRSSLKISSWICHQQIIEPISDYFQSIFGHFRSNIPTDFRILFVSIYSWFCLHPLPSWTYFCPYFLNRKFPKWINKYF